MTIFLDGTHVNPEEVRREKVELDIEKLEEIRNKSEQLADIIKKESNRIKNITGIKNVEICYHLSNVYNAIQNANIKINRVIERRKSHEQNTTEGGEK